MEPLQKATIGDETLSICQEDQPQSPREYDNLGKMICYHNRYHLGDKHTLSSDDLKALIKRKDVIALPLYLYDHSGLTMSTKHTPPYNNHWDSSMLGYIYVTYETIRKEYNKKHVTRKLIDKVLNVLESEVKTYDQYLRNDIYGFTVTKAVTCKTCDHTEHEVIDSCWGFYGIDLTTNGMLEHLDDKWKTAKMETCKQ